MKLKEIPRQFGGAIKRIFDDALFSPRYPVARYPDESFSEPEPQVFEPRTVEQTKSTSEE